MKSSIPSAVARLELTTIERQIRSLSLRKNYLKRVLGERTRPYVWHERKVVFS